MTLKYGKKVNEEGEAAPTNNTDSGSFATYAKPLFVTKRWAGMKEYEVPPAAYNKMRSGRDLGDKWADFIDDETLRSDVRNTFHTDGKLIVTCSERGCSAIVRKMPKT